MSNLSAYLPQDRLRALARGETLPDRTSGVALFADISGFTPLTEALGNTLGPRRGAEELTHHLDAVYSALIQAVEDYGGSVLGFAGDAVTCWFDDADTLAAPRAASCAFALQAAMRTFQAIRLPNGSTTALTLKVAVATGPARRLMVGDPTIQYLDALAGATVTRTATAEHLAAKGDILLDEATVAALGSAVMVSDWRTDAETHERFARATVLTSPVEKIQASEPSPRVESEILKGWLPSDVYEREQGGQGAFLTEFRPAVALFVRFGGLDYEVEDAQQQLDAFLRRVQAILARYGGTLIQLTIGDKGSYVYLSFGAPSAHEDDARRAVRAAHELRAAAAALSFLEPLQIGITRGTLRVGAYGGPTRKTFGALGDDVNLAARLMTTAAPGEVLVSGNVHKAVEAAFVFEPRPPLPMKGKAEPLPVFAVTGERKQRAIRLQEPTYALPMVGRQQELHTISEKLDLCLHGRSQVIGIVAEAGLGKSRLVAEVIRAARRKRFAGYGGACQSDGINTSYLAWKPIWSAFFDLDPAAPLRKQLRSLEGEIEDRAPERVQALPLLSSVLDLAIPDNEFTANLEPQYRKSALTALLKDCLRAASQDEPLLLVVEDLHWVDALSHDLLEDLARALADSPVCFVLAYRPPQLTRLQAPRLEALPQFTRIELHELTRAEAESAIRAKLAQLYPARTGSVPARLVDTLMTRAQGNPFYLEELLNYLHDRGLDPRDPTDLGKIELPDSLHALVLSRIDQLSEREKTTLRVASIVGRLFRAAWLTGYYPALGELAQVKLDLDQLDKLEITPLDSEPELAYLFKHIVTHEVTYESLPFGLRAQLHEQLAIYLEQQIEAGVLTEAAMLDTLVYHYTHSENHAKQRLYLKKAGEAAQEAFANDAALEYYGKLLSLLKDAKEQTQVHVQRGEVLQVIGKSGEAESDYRAALALAQAQDDLAVKAGAQFALGRLNRFRGDFAAALDWLAQAKEARTALQDTAGLAQVFIETGMVLFLKGEYAQARDPLNEGLALAREAGDKLTTARALNNLANVTRDQGDYPTAQTLFEESLALRRELGDKRGVSDSIWNLGYLAYGQGRLALARELNEERLALRREMGDKWGIAVSLAVLGSVIVEQGDYAAAQTLFDESLALGREMDNKWCIAETLSNLGYLRIVQGDYTAARAYLNQSLSMYRELGIKSDIAGLLPYLGMTALHQGEYQAARAAYVEGLTLSAEIGAKPPLAYNLAGWAALASAEGMAARAARLAGAAETVRVSINITFAVADRRLFERTIAAAKERLGAAGFQSAWEAGAAMSLEEAVKFALNAAL